MAIKKVLCVCKGNSDRSPLLAAVLQLFMKDAEIHSAGILDLATGRHASHQAVTAGRRFGLELGDHRGKKIEDVPHSLYDLVVCVDDSVVTYVSEKLGIPTNKIYNVQVGNCYPVKCQADFDEITLPKILLAAARVARYCHES